MKMARFLQLVLLAALALASLCFHLMGRAGLSLWAWVALLTPLMLLAAALLLEFGLLAFKHESDPAPKAHWAQLCRAWWSELRCAVQVFCWRQPFFAARWSNLVPLGSAIKSAEATHSRGVVLIHGYFCNRALWNPWLQRLQVQGTPFVAVNLEPLFGSIDDYVTTVEHAVQQMEQATGCAPVVVAHSMGGLVFRRWWAEQLGTQGDLRIHHAITLGTPHQGTWLARFATTTNSRQMRPGSPWLLNLVRREATVDMKRRCARMTCFYSHCDNIVFPPSWATLPGADNRHLAGLAHVQMLESEVAWQALQQLLVVPAATQTAQPI